MVDLKSSSRPNPRGRKILYRWFSVIDAELYQKKALLPVKKLKDSLLSNSEVRRTLYGFIVFEVAWTSVRGINYLNELQVLLLQNSILCLAYVQSGKKTGREEKRLRSQ